MSGSALFAAKKRLESSLRKFEVPCQDTPQTVSDSKNGVLLLALLQSRLNWTTSVFAKYKQDPIFQPKRTTTTRKKWPNLHVLGVVTLQLGPHTFPETTFYEAVRTESWLSIAKKQGLSCTDDDDDQTLTYRDIVFELKEAPNDRFIFPKNAILEFTPSSEMLASFVLPLDQKVAEYYFEPTKDKIVRWGESCQLKCIKVFLSATTHTLKTEEEEENIKTYQPVNIRATNVSTELKETMISVTHSPAEVLRKMRNQMKLFPKRKYLKYNVSEEEESVSMEVNDLIKRATTVPDITTGPILAEKKRNEILNAIRTGKRPRDEKFEAELPKHKHINNREDGMLRCAYCSTKYTSMWRPGPNGQGTLCNACGIQWKNREILKDAPVITPQEEKQLLKEKKEREKILARLEEEKQEREKQRLQKKLEKQVLDAALDARKHQSNTCSLVTHNLIQQKNKHQSQKQTTTIKSTSSSPKIEQRSITASAVANVNKIIPVTPKIATVPTTTTTTTTTSPTTTTTTTTTANNNPTISTASTSIAKIAPAATTTPTTANTIIDNSESEGSINNTGTSRLIYPTLVAQQQQQQQQSMPLLYSSKGIPLPTLSVDFDNQASFNHPRCGVTLLDHHFSLRLSFEPSNQIVIDFTKLELRDSLFEVIEQEIIPREILKMTIRPNKCTYIIHGSTVHVEKDHPVTIRFLEKIDPNGGAVVKRILERWIYFST